MFKLRNPNNAAASTHAGVLEFIATEGVVHLPYWMMKTLRLNEGDPIRITGTELPKGKMVKLQAQSMHFTEVSDPKAVWVLFFLSASNRVHKLIQTRTSSQTFLRPYAR
jgi:ubiquitin fusion degradation protein 1